MAGAVWSIPTGGAVSLAAGTAKSVLGVRAGAAFSVYLKRYRIAFDGVTASAVPVLIELCGATFATNPPGTASTSVTPVLTTGRSTAVGVTAAKNWTTEPTALTVIEEILLTPNGGVLMYDFPLQDEPDTDLNGGFVLRLTAPATVNVRADIAFGRC